MNCSPFPLNENSFYGGDFCDNRSQIVVKDKGSDSSYLGLNLKNSRQICRIQVDGSLISSQKDKKCDYLLIDCPKTDDEIKDIIFIELKDPLTQFDEACEQILSTISILKAGLQNTRIHARIVLRKRKKEQVPDLKGSNYRTLRTKIKERLQFCDTGKMVENFENRDFNTRIKCEN